MQIAKCSIPASGMTSPPDNYPFAMSNLQFAILAGHLSPGGKIAQP
jgi:hypothetical protein